MRPDHRPPHLASAARIRRIHPVLTRGVAIRGCSSMSVVRGPSISLLPAARRKTSPLVGDFDRDINQLDGSPRPRAS